MNNYTDRFQREASGHENDPTPLTQEGEDMVHQNLIEQLGRFFMVLPSAHKDIDTSLPYYADAKEAFEVFRAYRPKIKKEEGEDIRKENEVLNSVIEYLDRIAYNLGKSDRPASQRQIELQVLRLKSLSTLPSTTENKEEDLQRIYDEYDHRPESLQHFVTFLSDRYFIYQKKQNKQSGIDKEEETEEYLEQPHTGATIPLPVYEYVEKYLSKHPARQMSSPSDSNGKIKELIEWLKEQKTSVGSEYDCGKVEAIELIISKANSLIQQDNQERK